MGYFLQRAQWIVVQSCSRNFCRRSPELSRAKRSEEEGAAEPEPEGEPEPEDDYYCVKKSMGGNTLKSCLPKVSLVDGRPMYHLPCCCSGQPLVCSISCQRIICRRSPNRGQILDKLNACWIFPLQAVADPLKMACSMLPGVGDVCVCQDQVIALSTKRRKKPSVFSFYPVHKYWTINYKSLPIIMWHIVLFRTSAMEAFQLPPLHCLQRFFSLCLPRSLPKIFPQISLHYLLSMSHNKYFLAFQDSFSATVFSLAS